MLNTETEMNMDSTMTHTNSLREEELWRPDLACRCRQVECKCGNEHHKLSDLSMLMCKYSSGGSGRSAAQARLQAACGLVRPGVKGDRIHVKCFCKLHQVKSAQQLATAHLVTNAEERPCAERHAYRKLAGVSIQMRITIMQRCCLKHPGGSR